MPDISDKSTDVLGDLCRWIDAYAERFPYRGTALIYCGDVVLKYVENNPDMVADLKVYAAQYGFTGVEFRSTRRLG